MTKCLQKTPNYQILGDFGLPSLSFKSGSSSKLGHSSKSLHKIGCSPILACWAMLGLGLISLERAPNRMLNHVGFKFPNSPVFVIWTNEAM